jgi:hypothetical protein
VTVTVVVPGQTSGAIDEVEITGPPPKHPISAPNLKRDEATAALDDGSKAAIGRQGLRGPIGKLPPGHPGRLFIPRCGCRAGAEQHEPIGKWHGITSLWPPKASNTARSRTYEWGRKGVGFANNKSSFRSKPDAPSPTSDPCAVAEHPILKSCSCGLRSEGTTLRSPSRRH